MIARPPASSSTRPPFAARLASLALAIGVAVLAALTGGCGGGGSGGSPPSAIPVGQVVPDFTLLDVNPASATSGLEVSPRDALGSGSAWYFGHAT